MAKLPILTFPNPRLRNKAQPVREVDGKVRQLVADMLETMYAAPGIGLAAIQVDVPLRVVVIDVSDTNDAPLCLINPEIIELLRRWSRWTRVACRSPASTRAYPAPSVSGCAHSTGTASPSRWIRRRPAGGVHPARDRPPRRQALRRLPLVPQTPAHPPTPGKGPARPGPGPGRGSPSGHLTAPHREMAQAMTARILFAGTPEFAVPCLTALTDGPGDGGIEVVGVYTQPDRPAGRGRKLAASPVKQAALDRGLPVLQPQTLRDKDAQAQLRALDADLMVVVAYGLLLPKRVLAAPRLGCVNVHASLLPRWRGAAPIQRAILAGDSQTGVTIMGMEAGLDTGPMFLTHATPDSPAGDRRQPARPLVPDRRPGPDGGPPGDPRRDPDADTPRGHRGHLRQEAPEGGGHHRLVRADPGHRPPGARLRSLAGGGDPPGGGKPSGLGRRTRRRRHLRAGSYPVRWSPPPRLASTSPQATGSCVSPDCNSRASAP